MGRLQEYRGVTGWGGYRSTYGVTSLGVIGGVTRWGGLVLRCVYPFGLNPRRVVGGVAGWRVGEENLHVVRHFFKKVGRNESLVSVELALRSAHAHTHIQTVGESLDG